MAATDLTNAMDEAGETANVSNELEKAQIICVIGKVSFALISIFVISLLMEDL